MKLFYLYNFLKIYSELKTKKKTNYYKYLLILKIKQKEF